MKIAAADQTVRERLSCCSAECPPGLNNYRITGLNRHLAIVSKADLSRDMEFITYNQWQQLPASANQLFDQAERRSLFASRTWLENLTTYALNDDQTMLLACVVEQKCFLAIVPMIKTAQGSLRSLSNQFTTLFTPLISTSGQAEVILDCLVNGLLRMSLQPIRFEPIETDDDNMKKLRQLMESRGLQSQTYFRLFNWTHPLNGQTYEEYMASRPARLRNTIRRKQRKLQQTHQCEIRLYKDAPVDQALLDYAAVYRKSWKANERATDFTPALVKSLCNLGRVRLAILYVDQQPVAAQIWFVIYGRANIYRLVHAEEWKMYSPGSILTQHVMRHVIDTDGVSEIDFLTGNEPYKQDWMTVRKERIGILFAKRPKRNNNPGAVLQTVARYLYSKMQRVSGQRTT